MRKEDRQLGKWRVILFGCVGLLVILTDQLTKFWIRDWSDLTPGDSLFEVGFFRFIFVKNTGAAFGIFKEHTQTIIVVAFVGIIVILLLVFLLRSRWKFLDSMLVMSAIGLVMGGTIGNQIDRVWLGYVTDFIDVTVWPTFNIADASAVVGTIILVYCLVFRSDLLKSKE